MKSLSIPLGIAIITILIGGGSAVHAKEKPRITMEQALEIARDFLKKRNNAARYLPDNPLAYVRDDEYWVEFKSVTKYSKPGLCIIAVHRKTGAARLQPVE